MYAVTIETLPGFEIIDVIGQVLGTTARPPNAFLEGVRSLSKTASKEYSDKLSGWRREAIDRMMDSAYEQGGNAVVGLRFDHRSIGAWSEICAYGTAVFVVPQTSDAPSAAGADTAAEPGLR